MNEFMFESFKNHVSKYVVGEDDIIKLIYVGINAARRSKNVTSVFTTWPAWSGQKL
jgi:hypothetical protein